MYKAYADGGCRPKNNRCKDSFGFYGFVIFDKLNQEIYNENGKLGNYSTNNIAEFISLKKLLEYINQNLKRESITIYMDSLLVVNITNNKWKLKNQILIPINNQIQKLINKNVEIKWIPRDENLADKLTRL